MSNRADRRKNAKEGRGRHTPTKVKNEQPADIGPIVTCFVENNMVVMQIAIGRAWVNQLAMPLEYARQFYQEYGDCLRELDTGLKVEHRHSGTGLYVP